MNSEQQDQPASFGRYQVRGLLGEGGHGAVYLGYDPQLDRKVAIKVSLEGITSEEIKQRFFQEARQLAQLKHPGIVGVHDLGIEGERCYIIYDYLSGSTLWDWLSKRQPTWQQSAAICADIADALAYAHSHRTIHRDLKPGNIILEDGTKPVILDFGLAVSDLFNSMQHRGVIAGTPAFMSPEQAAGRGHRIDGRTDIYSLGVILYRMLTGILPFRSQDTDEVLRQVREDEPQPPRQLVPALPWAIERICLKAMAKRIEDRFETASDMANALRRAMAAHTGGDNPITVKAAVLEDDALEDEGTSNVRHGWTPPNSKPQPAVALLPAPSSGPSSRRRPRGPEQRHVTICRFACDVFSNAQITEHLDAEQQHQVLVEFLDLCREAAAEFDGTVLNETSHGLVICYGFPVAFEDAASRAIRAALMLQQEMPHLNRRFQAQYGVEISAWSVIHSDYAVVELRDNGTVRGVGPMFAVTEQLEAQGKPGTVTISEAVHALAGHEFETQSLGTRSVRGLNAPCELFQVLRPHLVVLRLDQVASDSLTPLIGRDSEIALLEDRWRQAVDGRGQVVTLVGDPGLGKSRLACELREYVLRQASATVLSVIEWRCVPYRQDSSLYPIIDCFERLLDFAHVDSEDERLDRLVTHMENLGFTDQEDQSLLAKLLSIPASSRLPVSKLSPVEQKRRQLDLVIECICRFAEKQRGLLFIIENLHWIDPTTLELIEHLIPEIATQRLLALFTFRPEFKPSWRSVPYLTQVSVNPLNRQQVEEMVRCKLGQQEISPEIMDQIVERCDGVPLFVEEFAELLTGTAESSGGEDIKRIRPFGAHEIPATLQDLLMARLDQVANDIEVAQLCSVIGREFPVELVEALSPLSQDALNRELMRLVDAGILLRRGRGPGAPLAFKHALIQDAAYQSLMKRNRQKFHKQVAAFQEKLPPAQREKCPELLAHHLTEAGRPERAIGYWTLAGRQAIDRCAHREAIGHLTKALELLKELPDAAERGQQELELRVALAMPLQAVKGYGSPEVQQSLLRARELCHQLGDCPDLLPMLCGLHRSAMLQAEYATAKELAEQACALADAAGAPAMIAAAHRAMGSTLIWLAHYEASKNNLERVLSIQPSDKLRAECRRYDVIDPWCASRTYLAWVLWLSGYPDQALEQSKLAIRESNSLKHPFSETLTLSADVWLRFFCNDAKGAHPIAQRALAIAEEHGFGFWIGWCRAARGWTILNLGQPLEGIQELTEGIDDWNRRKSKLNGSLLYALVASVSSWSGDNDAGLEHLALAERFSETTGEVFWLPEVHRLKGELQLARNGKAVDAAEACFQKALNLARKQGSKSLELRAATSLARLWHRQGRTEEARDLLASIYEWFTEGFDTFDLRKAQSLLDALAPQQPTLGPKRNT